MTLQDKKKLAIKYKWWALRPRGAGHPPRMSSLIRMGAVRWWGLARSQLENIQSQMWLQGRIGGS